MNPKEKAKELSDKFKEITHDNKEITLMSLRLRKKCALICVQYLQDNGNLLDIVYKEFEQVKKEINKL